MGVLCKVLVLLCSTFVLSSFAIISLGKGKLVAVVLLSSWCRVAVIVLCFFVMVPLVGL